MSQSDDQEQEKEIMEYSNSYMYPNDINANKVRDFHPADDNVYKGVLLCLEYCHKHMIDWEAAPGMLKINIKDAFRLAKKQLYDLIDLYSKCNSGLMQFSNFMLQMMLEGKWTKSHFFIMVTLIPHFWKAVVSENAPIFT